MRFIGDDDDKRQANYIDEFINKSSRRQVKHSRLNNTEIIVDFPEQSLEFDIKTNGSFDANSLVKKVQ